MRILMTCAEVAPLGQHGPAAEAVAALAKTLARLDHEVTVALPRHRSVTDSGLMLARRLKPIKLEVGEELHKAVLYDARLAPGVELVLLDVGDKFDRDGVYEEDGTPYEDNAERYGLFCRAVEQVVQKRKSEGRPFDVVHAHDWSTALVPYLLRAAGTKGAGTEDEGGAEGEEKPRTVLTIHNGSETGQFDNAALSRIGLGEDEALAKAAECGGGVSFLKVGVSSADAVVTVSAGYGRSLSAAGAEPKELAALYAERELLAVNHGVDYALWSPSTDPLLPARYDAEDVANKGSCKSTLLAELDLPLDPERPLLVSLPAGADEEVADALSEAIGMMGNIDTSLVVVGAGQDAPSDKRLEQAAQAHPEYARYLDGADERMRHRLLAAADGVLFASESTRADVGILAAQRYGAAPVARATASSSDMVVDCDAEGQTGTGFLFEASDAEALTGAAGRAVSLIRSEHWGQVRRRMMRLDVSWERAARRYARIYQAPADA